MTLLRTLRSAAWPLALLLFVAGCTGSQVTVQDTPAEEQAEDEDRPYEPYDEVVTDDYETDEGLVIVHRKDDDVLYELPDSLMGEELLLVSRIARTATDIGYGGEKANTQVVRWERNGDRVLLRMVSYENVADEDEPIYQAVRNSNFEPILMSFDVKALGEDTTSVVIDATPLFTTDVPSLGLQQSRRESYKAGRLDSDRTFITSVKSFPRNVEVRNVLTYQASEAPSNSETGTISLEMNHSMVRLPEDPMTPRPCDDRVGYFSVERINYGLDSQRAEEECFITRWRLEPSDPEAFARGELVEPVEPITYYIDPATPEQWRPYLKQGVEDWNVAFERAGFKNAIRALDPPSPEEDPEFSPEDVRYSVIRYFSSETQNAYGPHVHDPRTGEILESDIGWYHNVMSLLRNWYFVQTAAANPRARATEYPVEEMGELIRFVSAHEVGHTLGLPHNWGSSAAFPVDSLRSPTFTAEHGTAPSIMDYARFNYVAQPEDEVEQFFPQIGEYDKWAIEWGYQPIPEAETLEEQEEVLDQWIVQHAGDPLYFYGRQTGQQIDPRSQREDLGDDAVEASRLGILNLERIVDNLVDWTYEEGEDYEQLEEIYGRLVGQYRLYTGHVARQIGGVQETYRTYDQAGPVYVPTEQDKQRAAMEFLQQYVFQTPTWLLEPEVLRRIEHAGAVERIRDVQVDALEMVMDPQRIARLVEAEAVDQIDAYTPYEMMQELRRGIWSELVSGEDIGPFRRNVQRGYLARAHELMTEDLEAPPERYRSYFGFTPVDVQQSDVRPLVRGELLTLRYDIEQALRRHAMDPVTRYHLQDALVRIDRTLDPNVEG